MVDDAYRRWVYLKTTGLQFWGSPRTSIGSTFFLCFEQQIHCVGEKSPYGLALAGVLFGVNLVLLLQKQQMGLNAFAPLLSLHGGPEDMSCRPLIWQAQVIRLVAERPSSI